MDSVPVMYLIPFSDDAVAELFQHQERFCEQILLYFCLIVAFLKRSVEYVKKSSSSYGTHSDYHNSEMSTANLREENVINAVTSETVHLFDNIPLNVLINLH